MSSELLAKELQQVIKEDYGKDISVSEAGEILSNLVGYFDLLARIDHQTKVTSSHMDHGTQKIK